jgi:hypothetical protein
MEFIIVTSVFLTIVMLNIFIAHLIVKKTTNTKIIPKLNEYGFEFVRMEKIGFLKTGDFRESGIEIRPYNPLGKFKICIYRYVFYFDKSKKLRRTTVKIDWNLFRKTRIDFKLIKNWP